MSYTVIEKTGQGREWLAGRHTLIGASEGPTIVNLSSFESPRELWERKQSGLVNDNDIDLFYFAHELEEPIAKRAAQKWPDRFGRMLPSPGLLRWDEHPHLGATPDRLVETDDAGAVTFQIKTVGPYMRALWGDAKTQEDVPDAYRIQVIQESAVLGKPYGYIEPLFGLTDLAEPIRIDTDVEFLEWYVAESEAWWQRHMIEGVEPDVVLGDDLVARWPGNVGERIDATPDIVNLARAAKRWRDIERKEAEDADEEAKFRISEHMQDATELFDPETDELLVTWRPKKSPIRFDVARFRDEQPDLWAEYSGPGKPERSMLFKPTRQSKLDLAAHKAAAQG